MMVILFFSFIAAVIIVYVIPRGGGSMGPKPRPMTEKERRISVLDDLVANRISYIEGITSMDYCQGRRETPKLAKSELKEKLKVDVWDYAAKECQMTEEQLSSYLDKRIRECTGR